MHSLQPIHQKVTRRVAHEICEKRKLEEQEFELSKRVKTEGDVNEELIKKLIKQVEAEQADVENDVILFIVPILNKIYFYSRDILCFHHLQLFVF